MSLQLVMLSISAIFSSSKAAEAGGMIIYAKHAIIGHSIDLEIDTDTTISGLSVKILQHLDSRIVGITPNQLLIHFADKNLINDFSPDALLADIGICAQSIIEYQPIPINIPLVVTIPGLMERHEENITIYAGGADLFGYIEHGIRQRIRDIIINGSFFDDDESPVTRFAFYQSLPILFTISNQTLNDWEGSHEFLGHIQATKDLKATLVTVDYLKSDLHNLHFGQLFGNAFNTDKIKINPGYAPSCYPWELYNDDQNQWLSAPYGIIKDGPIEANELLLMGRANQISLWPSYIQPTKPTTNYTQPMITVNITVNNITTLIFQ